MAQCIKCKATIPNGTQYCKNCYSLEKNKADESYLDSLLSSITPSDNIRDIYLKNKTETVDMGKPEPQRSHLMNNQIEDRKVKPIPKDYSIFSTSENDSDFDFLDSLFTNEEEMQPQLDKVNNNEDEIEQKNSKRVDNLLEDDSFDYNEIINQSEDNLPKVEVTGIIEELPQEDSPNAQEDIQNVQKDNQIAEDLQNSREDIQNPHTDDYEIEVIGKEDQEEGDQVKEEDQEPEDQEPENPWEEGQSNYDQEPEDSSNQYHDNAIDELLSEILPYSEGLDEVSDQSGQDTKQASTSSEEEEPANMKDAYEFSDNDQDILDLINEINNTQEMPPEELENEKDTKSGGNQKEEKANSTVDIGDVFADALGAVSSLEDAQIDDDLLNMIPDIEDRSIGKSIPNHVSDQKSEKKPKNKPVKETKQRPGLWKRIFGNIKEELTEEEIEVRKNQVIKEGEEKEQQESLKKEELKAKKEQDKAAKAEKAQQAKELAAKKKAEKAAKDKAKKEEKERRSREIQELIDEIDENEGKINKVGASIVFVFFAATAIVIVIGTNLYSYAVNIKNATTSFDRQLYNEAYQNVYGIDIKDEDLEIYDRIMTVMYVNKQLNSYNNFLNMKKYPEALDSLLKGLDRYEKYYMLATLHGIENDLNYVKEHIVEELNQTFYLSEDDARDLLAYKDKSEYSSEVYRLANEHAKQDSEKATTQDPKADLESDTEKDTKTQTNSDPTK